MRLTSERAQETGASLRRRWYVFALCLILSALGAFAFAQREGVYYTQFNVVLLAPSEEFYPNQIEDPRYALAPLAGAIAAEWNGNDRPLFTASGDTTLFGEGVREGVQVRVPNQGSQWEPAYFSPVINVQVVGSSPEAVRSQARAVGDELRVLLDRRQEAAGIRKGWSVTAITAPETPTVEHINGSRFRALGAWMLIGLISSAVMTVGVDRILRSKRWSSSSKINGAS